MAEQRPDRPIRNTTRPGGTSGGGMRFGRGLFGWILFIGLAIMLIALFQMKGKQYVTIAFSEFENKWVADRVKTITIDGDDLKGEFNSDKEVVAGVQTAVQFFYTPMPAGMASNWQFMQWLSDHDKHAEVRIENSPNIIVNLLVPFIPWLVIFGFIWFFVFRQLRNSAGAGGMLGNFGRSRHKITSKEHTNITFDDVAGVEEAKEEVMEIVDFLKNPKKFQ